MMAKAQAIRFVAPGQVELVEVDSGSPDDDEVSVRILASALCNHSELRAFRGGQRFGYGSRYPMVPGEPGHEAVGRIDAVGREVSDLAEGDLVVMTGMGGEPVHRSHLTRQARTVAKVTPGRRDPRSAAILEMFGCAYHCVRVGWQRSGGYDNARVGVIGVGAIGLCAVQILRNWPLAELVALDMNQAKLDLAASVGASATHLVPADLELADVRRRFGSFDVVAECTGNPRGHELANALGPRTLINVSYCPEPFRVYQGAWFAANTTIYNPGILTSEELRAVANLYNRGSIDPDAMITRRIKPTGESYLAAIDEISSGRIVKTLIEWGS